MAQRTRPFHELSSTHLRLRGRLILTIAALISLLAILTSLVTQRISSQTIVFGAPTPPANQLPLTKIDHSGWTELLNTYVDQNGMVDYRRWHRHAVDVNALDQYLSQLSRGDLARPSRRDASLAFWINAYNALTIRGILLEYPTSSIRQHTPRWWGYHIWHDLRLVVGHRSYSLHEIEHEVLRPLGDPRIHFAINCASRGCPKLSSTAYTADGLDQQLESQARQFFADDTNFRHDARTGEIHVSEILRWFADDFGPDLATRRHTIAPWLPSDAARRALAKHDGTWHFLPYDWQLNQPTE